MRNAIIAATLLIAAPALAAQLDVTSYDTPNGSGQASGGTYNYWDGTYDGSGSTTTDGAPLSGGTGALTNGVIAGGTWQTVSNNAGTGPEVGWYYGTTPNPAVVFHFDPRATITSIRVDYDNSTAGSVYAPARILIDGVDTMYMPNGLGGLGSSTFSGLALTGPTHTIEFDQRDSGAFAFVSEVSFFGSAAPEPASWALLIVGFGLTGAALRSSGRRRPATAR